MMQAHASVSGDTVLLKVIVAKSSTSLHLSPDEACRLIQELQTACMDILYGGKGPHAKV